MNNLETDSVATWVCLPVCLFVFLKDLLCKEYMNIWLKKRETETEACLSKLRTRKERERIERKRQIDKGIERARKTERDRDTEREREQGKKEERC